MSQQPEQINGELLAPRAADGERLVPAASTFAEFVSFLEGGRLSQDLGVELRDICSDLRDAAIAGNGKAKGQLSITFDFSIEGDTFFVTAKHKVKLPEDKRQRSIVWATEDGRFTPHAPRQGQLFGVRDVTPAPVRNV